MSDLVVVVPSRGRPAQARELAETFAETCTGDTRLTFSVDSNDPDAPGYVDAVCAANEARPGMVDLVSAGNANMADALNRVAVQVTQTPVVSEDVEIRFRETFAVAFMGDDHRPRTVGWDTAYVKALRELGTGIVYGDDLLQRENLPTQVAMTSDIVRTLGYMTPPGLGHMYLDNFWRDLGRGAECLRYLPDVVVEHVHPVAGKVAWDEGYARVNDAAVYDRDRRAYQKFWTSGDFQSAVDKVRALRGAA